GGGRGRRGPRGGSAPAAAEGAGAGASRAASASHKRKRRGEIEKAMPAPIMDRPAPARQPPPDFRAICDRDHASREALVSGVTSIGMAPRYAVGQCDRCTRRAPQERYPRCPNETNGGRRTWLSVVGPELDTPYP